LVNLLTPVYLSGLWVGDPQIDERAVDVLVRAFAEWDLHDVLFLTCTGFTASHTKVVPGEDAFTRNIIAAAGARTPVGHGGTLRHLLLRFFCVGWAVFGGSTRVITIFLCCWAFVP
jgi:hypothetical protein